MKKKQSKPMLELKILRVRKGMTQADLAEKVGVSQNTISLYEAGNRFPRNSVLEKLAAALECEVKDIIWGGVVKISIKELQEAAKPLIELLRVKGHPMMVVHVTDEGADLFEALCGTEKRPCED